ncbi:MAG: cell division protein SepF [Candidatus Diapherotrites archaeon]|nr:cell division protein SepF [Candidatus Diapherotrites archaeon]
MAFVERLLGQREEVDIEHFLNNLDAEDVSEYSDAEALVKPITLMEEEDAKVIAEEIRKGNIILANIVDLSKRNVSKLRELIGKIKVLVDEVDGDIARVSQERILITPAKIKIVKRRA